MGGLLYSSTGLRVLPAWGSVYMAELTSKQVAASQLGVLSEKLFRWAKYNVVITMEIQCSDLNRAEGQEPFPTLASHLRGPSPEARRPRSSPFCTSSFFGFRSPCPPFPFEPESKLVRWLLLSSKGVSLQTPLRYAQPSMYFAHLSKRIA